MITLKTAEFILIIAALLIIGMLIGAFLLWKIAGGIGTRMVQKLIERDGEEAVKEVVKEGIKEANEASIIKIHLRDDNGDLMN